MSRVLGSALLIFSLSLMAHAEVEPDDEPDALGLILPTIQGGAAVTEDDAVVKSTRLLWGKGGICSGTLIGADLILTAGHCVPDASDGRILMAQEFGSQATIKEIKTRGKIFETMGFIRHPDYRVTRDPKMGTLIENDLAVIRLASPVVGARPALLPRSDTVITTSDPLMIVGFGFSKSSDQLIEPKNFIFTLRKASVTGTFDPRFPARFTIHGPANACPGDSGGASYAWSPEGLIVIGIASTANGCSDPRFDARAVSYETYVPFFTEWIKSAAKELRSLRKI